MYSDYPSIVFYILLLLMLSGGIIFIARQSPQKFVFQMVIWAGIFLVVFVIISFFTHSFAANSDSEKISVSDITLIEECLDSFYQGRPRDYPPKTYIYKNDKLRGMELVCYQKIITDN